MTTRTLSLLLAAAAALTLAGCQTAEDTAGAKTASKVTQTGASDCSGDCTDCDKTGDCKHEGGHGEGHECGGGQAGEGHECGGGQADEGEGHDCSGGADTKLAADELVERTDQAGRKVMHAGQEFTEATPVTVADLVDRRADFLGKVVKVEGDIMAMCTHKRGWFAMVGKDDSSGKQLRAFTAPVFLVPEGSIGKSVRVEGTVDEVEVPAQMAKHFAESHKLDVPEGDAAIKQVVLRATAAEFYE